jgi:hypothetical protein
MTARSKPFANLCPPGSIFAKLTAFPAKQLQNGGAIPPPLPAQLPGEPGEFAKWWLSASGALA